jgi:tRNA pseudouridine38-40 synthase
MTAFRLELAYDGAPFAGWAAQPGFRTVQGEVEAAIERTLSGRAGRLTAAGRTDAGVHARAQVASFELGGAPPDGLRERLNAVLPREIVVLSAEAAPEGFDARRWARSRTYRYRVLASRVRNPFEEGRALWWPHRLDRDALATCAGAVVGVHDFTAFTPTQTEHVRFERNVIEARWEPEPEAHGDMLAFLIEADAFMRNMVRVMVGTMLEVGRGRRSAEGFRELLDGAPRGQAGETAPAHGLYLERVTFGDGPLGEPQAGGRRPAGL